jgi:hypothetical protein
VPAYQLGQWSIVDAFEDDMSDDWADGVDNVEELAEKIAERKLSEFEKDSVEYIAGYIIRRVTENRKLCPKCKSLWTEPASG